MRLRALAALCAVLAGTFIGAAPASATPSEALPPPGANNWSCRPSAAHPNPVVLVHGLSATMFENWGYFSPELAKRGYCVFALTYGLNPAFGPLTNLGLVIPGGVIPMEQSARELGAFVDKVLAATGAKKVDLIGHSEGTVMPQYWLKRLGGAPKVDKYVALTPIYGGTRLLEANTLRDIGATWGLSKPVLDLLATACGSCPQFLVGSDYMKLINEGGPAAPGVKYTTLMTKNDELVIPYTSGYLPGAVHNYVVQDLCPTDPAEHAAVAFDPLALQVALNALDPAHARPLVCNRLPYLPDHPLVVPATTPTPNPAPRTVPPDPTSVGGAVAGAQTQVAAGATAVNSALHGLPSAPAPAGGSGLGVPAAPGAVTSPGTAVGSFGPSTAGTARGPGAVASVPFEVVRTAAAQPPAGPSLWTELLAVLAAVAFCVTTVLHVWRAQPAWYPVRRTTDRSGRD